MGRARSQLRGQKFKALGMEQLLIEAVSQGERPEDCWDGSAEDSCTQLWPAVASSHRSGGSQ